MQGDPRCPADITHLCPQTVGTWPIPISPSSALACKEPAAHRPFRDAFPVAEGHTLVTPKRHVDRAFDLPEEELSELWAQVVNVRRLLVDQLQPDGFNVGLNEGVAAGQTIGHAHIHVIPRWKGDVPDPRGGVRWVLPNKAAYW